MIQNKQNNFFNKFFFLIFVLILIFLLYKIIKYENKNNKKIDTNVNKDEQISVLDNKKKFKKDLIDDPHLQEQEQIIVPKICQTKSSIIKMLLNNILIICSEEKPHLLKIISPDGTELKYDYQKGKVKKITDSYGSTREYSPETYNLVEEKLVSGLNNIFKHQKKYDDSTGHLIKEIYNDNFVKEYFSCVNKETFPDGTIRQYYSHYFQDITPDKKVIKEYDLNSKKLTKIIFDNGYIREYSLYTNALIKEIFPDGVIKIFNSFNGKLIKKIIPNDKTEEYDLQTGILIKEIYLDGIIKESIKEYNLNNKLKKIILPNGTQIQLEEESGEIKQIITKDCVIMEAVKEYNPLNKKLIKWVSPDQKHIKEFDQETGTLLKEKLSDGTIKEYDPKTSLLIKETFRNYFFITYEYNFDTNELLRSIFSNGIIVQHNLN
ncbi:hypothetical protein LFWB_5580 [Candidatus Phytoplasma luffae]|uniref:Uncharacterized protein n=1 Tax=Loofah witches'-broom phytoplasma TaxID=35773 RepID=A0A975IMF8_LOWBP|nr:DUF2963 domain-containing protein [Candidatus Phytoplasma luffae]QTX03124.1 hypothetical protein LFWB_5580 [Candidatus Phytoplasma luffae]